MIIDSSAIIAILLGEQGYQALAEAIDGDEFRLMSTANVLEAALVIRSRRGEEGEHDLDAFLYHAGIESVAFDEKQLPYACEANRRFGKNSKARLNFGDCFAYALSRAEGEPLLFKGDDFWHTDVAIHPASARR